MGDPVPTSVRCCTDGEEQVVPEHAVCVQGMIRKVRMTPFYRLQAIRCEAEKLEVEIGVAMIKTRKVKILVVGVVAPFNQF